MEEERRRLCVVAAVICDGRKVLVTQRGYGECKDGWEFPGGKVKSGETLPEALVREIREELEVDIQVGEYLGEVEMAYPHFDLCMDTFFCRIIEGRVRLLEHEAARWLEIENLLEVELLPADVEVAKEIIKRGRLPWEEDLRA